MKSSLVASIYAIFERFRYDLLILTVALCVRILFLFSQSGADPLFLAWSVDETTYLADAQRLVDAGFSREGLKLPFWQPPGYMFMVALWISTGASPQSFIALQSLLGVVSAWMIYRIILNMFGQPARRHGMVAALLFSMLPAALYYDTKLLKPAWVIFLMLWILYLSLPRTREGWWPLRGLLAGLLVIFDVYFIIMPLALVCISGMKRGPLLAIAAGLIVTVGPIAALNATAKSGFILVSYNGPINLYVGNNEHWTDTYNTLPGRTWYKITLRHEHEPEADLTQPGSTRDYFVDDVVEFATKSPVEFIRGLATKALLFFSIRELPRNGAIFMHPFAAAAGAFLNTAVMLIAFICLPRLKREPMIMLLLVMIFAVNVIFFPTTRYRLPAIPLALIAIGAMAGQPARWVKRTTAFVAVLAALSTLLASKIVQYGDWRAFSLDEAAWREIDRGDPAHAEQLIYQAMEESALPRVLDTAGQIAMTHRRDANTALKLFEQASEQAPDFAQPYFNQARIRLLSGQPDAAYRLYNRYLNLIRPELSDFNDKDVRAASQALEFNARSDFEQGNLPKALERLIRLREIHQLKPGKDITITGLDRQIDMIRQRLENTAIP